MVDLKLCLTQIMNINLYLVADKYRCRSEYDLFHEQNPDIPLEIMNCYLADRYRLSFEPGASKINFLSSEILQYR